MRKNYHCETFGGSFGQLSARYRNDKRVYHQTFYINRYFPVIFLVLDNGNDCKRSMMRILFR
jgi:hypothetical protein